MVKYARGLFSVHDFSSREKIIFSLLKAAPHIKDWREPTASIRMKLSAHYFQPHPPGIHSEMPLGSNTTLLEAMRMNT